VTSISGPTHFDSSLGCLLSPQIAQLATQLGAVAGQLGAVAGLSPAEQTVVLNATKDSVTAALHVKLARVLLLELNGARIEGRLKGETGEVRWKYFLDISSKRSYWEGLSVHYPTLLARVERLVGNRCAALLEFAERWASDRAQIAKLCGAPPGALREVTFGAGDSHRGGRTVAIVSCEGGRVVYKPRSLAVEEKLVGFIAGLERDLGRPLPIRVPAVVAFADYGWAEFVDHRYAADDAELGRFYEGIGQWLAVMRLVAGTDMHSENLIAHRECPVIVDCETLFTPNIPPFPSGFGDAIDRAALLVSGTVLASGLLPARGTGLGFRGVDISGVGSLPGQQPAILLPDIEDAGTDLARIGVTPTVMAIAQNHPAPQPSIADFWPNVLNGFDELSNIFRRLDAQGELRKRLEAFETCRIRVVLRATETYAELARMLWHPVSLHDEEKSRAYAQDLLAKMAANVATAPGDPAVIAAEIDDLMIGDIPIFSAMVHNGVLTGPAGVQWLSERNLAEDAVRNWRDADFLRERNFVRAALVCAFISEGSLPKEVSLRPKEPNCENLDARRRRQAASIMRDIVTAAMHGRDGTVSWIAPVLSPSGWAVRPLGEDLYGGLSGLAVLAGAYSRERKADRADPVEGVEALFASLIRTLDMFEDKNASNREKNLPLRPPLPGGYMGLGSQIWSRLLISKWGLDHGDGVKRAAALARVLPAAAAADDFLEILGGTAGGIPPLLALARETGDGEFTRIARTLGDKLCDRAEWRGDQAYWVEQRAPNGMGGFAHGVTGIGWALHKLARATNEERYHRTAQAAFAFEEALFDEDDRSWRDLRGFDNIKWAAGWCHGSVGIGLARLDLDPMLKNETTRRSLRLAAAASWKLGVGLNHCACHGDMGAFELIDLAIAAGEGPEGLSRAQLFGAILTSIEEHGPISGMRRDAFVPSLLPGLGGIAYQLLRANPESALPSILTLEDSGALH
jgi:type 2 lantibiotic biosynthesis protein LanM